MLEIVLIITLYYLLFSTEMSFTHFASKYKIFLNISTMYTYLTSFCYIKYISRKFKLRPIQSDVDICFIYAHSRSGQQIQYACVRTLQHNNTGFLYFFFVFSHFHILFKFVMASITLTDFFSTNPFCYMFMMSLFKKIISLSIFQFTLFSL